MSAQTKLNSAMVHGALGVAALIGAVSGSWGVLWLAAAVLVMSSVYDGSIRGRRGR